MTVSWMSFIFLLQESAELSPSLGGGSDVVVPVGRLIFGLLLSVALAWAAVYLMRRQRLSRSGTRNPKGLFANRRGSRQRLTVLEARRSGSNSEICLFACDGREYLVAFAQGYAVLLRETDIAEADQEPSS